MVCHTDKYHRADVIGIERENERDESYKSTTNPQIVLQTPSVPTTLDGFANYYIETFYKRKVCKETYRIGTNQYKKHIAPHFNNMHLKRITPKQCQELLDRLDEQGKGKTADDVFSLLNMIFKAAIKHSVLHINPMDMVFHTQHERQHGSALTKDEEKLLLTSTAGTPQQIMFAIGLYTGMRPNDLCSTLCSKIQNKACNSIKIDNFFAILSSGRRV